MPPAFCFHSGSFQHRLVFVLVLIYQSPEMATQAMPQPSLSGAKIPPSAVASSPTAKASPWIPDRWRDLVLFVGTPALLIPICAASQKPRTAPAVLLRLG